LLQSNSEEIERISFVQQFVEEGPYAGLGCRNEPLSRDCIQDVALLSYLLTKWNIKRQKQQAESGALHLKQPLGTWAGGIGTGDLPIQ
jgi:hypothetical protein